MQHLDHRVRELGACRDRGPSAGEPCRHLARVPRERDQRDDAESANDRRGQRPWPEDRECLTEGAIAAS